MNYLAGELNNRGFNVRLCFDESAEHAVYIEAGDGTELARRPNIQHNSENEAPHKRSDAYDKMIEEALSTFL